MIADSFGFRDNFLRANHNKRSLSRRTHRSSERGPVCQNVVFKSMTGLCVLTRESDLGVVASLDTSKRYLPTHDDRNLVTNT